MPVVIALLNSFSGLAASAAGFVIQNNVLIVAGCLVGASGLILTVIMCKAMNRTLGNVLFGGFGATGSSASGEVEGEMKPVSVEDAYYVLEARRTEGEAVPLPAINVIIEACAQLEDLDRAFATWGELEAFGLAPDVHTFNALLHTCVRTREMGSGQRLLQRMGAADIKRDAQSYFL